MIRVGLDERNAELAAGLMRTMPSLVQKAAAAATNRTLITVRKEMSVRSRKRYTAKAKDIKQALFLKKAQSRMPRGIIIARGAPLPLTAFKLRERKRGPVRVQVLKTGSAKAVKGLFVKQFPSGYKGPMLRTQPARYPLASPYGPSVPKMIENQEIMGQLILIAEKTMNERFWHEIDWRLSNSK